MSANTSLWLTVSCLFLCTFGCSQSQPPSDRQPTQASQIQSSSTNAAELPVHIDGELSASLDQLLKSPEFSHGRWGVAVISLKDGKLIYEHNGDHLFTPASNMKVYTTAVALDLLGADYRWRTSVYSENQPDVNGIIRGDVILYGRGAPDLISANRNENHNSLEHLAKALVARGIKRIEGNIVGDESYFRGDPIGQGWQWNDLQWYFGAEASALTVNANSVEISITSSSNLNEPPKVVSNDLDGYLQLTNNLATVARNEEIKIGVHRGLSDNTVNVWGQYPVLTRGYGVSLSVHRPALWAASIFLRTLRTHGIVVDGVAKFRDSRVPVKSRFEPSGNHELAFVTSQSLSEIVKVTNKFSVNLYAELLLRTIGRERAAMLPDEREIGRELGDDERGTRLIELWLRNQKIDTRNLAIHDGSGLSRLNLVTPRATSQLLEAIRRTTSARIFTESLPVAGTDGTLQSRLQATSGRIAAKTGALTYVNSLSGYLTASAGQVYAFSITCNDQVETRNSLRLIDHFVLKLSAHFDSGTQAGRLPPKAKQ